MGIFFNFLSGGNVKVASYRLADKFFEEGGDYRRTFIRYSLGMVGQMGSAKNPGFIYPLMNNLITNFTMLVVLDLWANAAPSNTPLQNTVDDFAQKVANHLYQRNIPEHYISATSDANVKLIDDLPEKIAKAFNLDLDFYKEPYR